MSTAMTIFWSREIDKSAIVSCTRRYWPSLVHYCEAAICRLWAGVVVRSQMTGDQWVHSFLPVSFVTHQQWQLRFYHATLWKLGRHMLSSCVCLSVTRRITQATPYDIPVRLILGSHAVLHQWPWLRRCFPWTHSWKMQGMFQITIKI